MRICFILANYFKYCKGGAQLQSYYLAHKLMRRGQEVHYIFDKNPDHFRDKKIMKTDDGIFLHPLRRYAFSGLGRCSFMSYFGLQKLLSGIDPDIIYVRTHLAHIGIAARYARRAGKKLIWATSSDADCKRMGLLRLNSNLLTVLPKAIDSSLALYGINRADQIIVQTREQQEMIQNNLKLDSIIIPNCHPVPHGPFRKVKPPWVVWIANLARWKQPEDFIRLAQKCLDLEAKFVMAGRPSGDRKWQEVIERKVDSLRNLDYLGEIDIEYAHDLLSKASIFVNTSLPKEGFPNTFIQAWMRETAVISLYFDPDDLITRKHLGFCSGNFSQLVKDVKKLILNPQLRSQIGSKARKYAIKNHNIESRVDHYLRIFNALLSN